MQHDEAHRAMWALPFYERAAMLIASMVEQDSDGLRFVARTACLAAYVAEQLSETYRQACIKILKDVTARLEAGLDARSPEASHIIHGDRILH
ncbi:MULTISPECIES: hypothetical protein [unclassified Bradyrhizobium]